MLAIESPRPSQPTGFGFSVPADETRYMMAASILPCNILA